MVAISAYCLPGPLVSMADDSKSAETVYEFELKMSETSIDLSSIAFSGDNSTLVSVKTDRANKRRPGS